jgi:hypothetical protein
LFRGTGELKNNPCTDANGVTHLLIFASVFSTLVSAGLYDVIGEASLASNATSAVIRTDSPVLRGTVRDVWGIFAGASLDAVWVFFRANPYAGQFVFWPFGVSPEGMYQLQALLGKKSLYFSNRSVWDNDDRYTMAHLPAHWEFVADYHLTADDTIDLTVPDASPATVTVAGPDGRPMEGALGYGATIVKLIELASGFKATSRVGDEVGRDGDGHRFLLFAAADVSAMFYRSGLFVRFETPMSPGDEVALLLVHWQDSPSVEPIPEPAPFSSVTPSPTLPPGPVPGSVLTTEPGRSGYWMVGSDDGIVYAFGDARHLGNAWVGPAKAVDLELIFLGNGYWVIDDQGYVFACGDAMPLSNVDLRDLKVGEKVTSLSGIFLGNGYWVFTTKGRVLIFGDAVHFGDMSGTVFNGSVLDSIPTFSGDGYYMVVSDGGIFAFGDARFAGSMGGKRLNVLVQFLVPDGDGSGYWLVAFDGGVFAFDAGFRGSMGGKLLNRSVSGMVSFGNGYLMVGEDGGIFNFSDREFLGSLGSNPLAQPIVSVAVLQGN